MTPLHWPTKWERAIYWIMTTIIVLAIAGYYAVRAVLRALFSR